MTNCTFNANSANNGIAGAGGAVSAQTSAVTMTNCTISGNDGFFAGGGIYLSSAPCSMSIYNTIVAGNNGGSGPDVFNDTGTTITSQGHNLIGKTDGSSGWIASDITGTSGSPKDAMLGPLINNGGPTSTMAPAANSPAVDAGDDAVLGSPYNFTTDQRGPGYPRKIGAHVDIGAFEFDNVPQAGPSFVVGTTDDHDDGTCDVHGCTLREAINAANSMAGDNTITFAPTITGTIQLGSALPNVTTNIDIQGPGVRVLHVSGSNQYRVFSFTGGTSSMSGLTIRSGRVAGTGLVAGAGILNQATLTMNDCEVTNNTLVAAGVTSGDGGNANGAGIINTGTLTLNRCTVAGNTATGGTGGTGSRGTPAGNGGQARGGGIYSGGTLTLTNCTISANTGEGGAGGSVGTSGGNGGNGYGGIYNGPSTTITACTISGNSGVGGAAGAGAAGSGVGGTNAAGTMTIRNTIIALNTASGTSAIPDVSGSVSSSNGYNLIGDGTGSSGWVAGDRIGVNPMLGSLQNNGGPTDTVALLSGSPAIDNGGSTDAPAQDQRYYLRNGPADIGAVEFGGGLAPMSAVSRKTHGTAGTFDVSLPFIGSSVGIECRTGGATNDHQLVLTFPVPVTVTGNPQAQITSGVGLIGSGGVSNGGQVTIAGSTVTVPLTSVNNAQKITITLSNVSDGVNTNSALAVPMGVLLGDVNQDTFVLSGDYTATRARSGSPVNASTFKYDVNIDGFILSGDYTMVRAQSGSKLP